MGVLKKRIIKDFTFAWKFYEGDAVNAQYIDFDDSKWRDINIPHDWSIEGPFSEDNPSTSRGGYLPGGVGWYRKTFMLPEEYREKSVLIEFDGIHMNSDVWINGHHLGHYPYGYSSFNYDMTEFLNFGHEPNRVAVRVDNSLQPASRWYTGAGIYRDVRLVICDSLRIKQWGTYITTPHVSQENADILIRTEVCNDGETDKAYDIINKVLSADGDEIAEVSISVSTSAKDMSVVEQSLSIENPILWSIDTPTLYTLYTSIVQNGEIVDDYITSFGIRKIEFDPNRGFILNGQQVKLKGVCLHHDNGCLGACAYYRAEERKLEILKEMGCNAIRTAHNPPSPQFLDLCDSMGFLVMDEAFDEWRVGKCPMISTKDGKKGKIIMYGYSRYFDEWHERDIRAMIRRDRNHLWRRGDYDLGILKNLNRIQGVNKNEIIDKNVNRIATAEYSMRMNMGLDFVQGLFIWTGFDYFGETTPYSWPSRSSYFGVIDTCGFPKDGFYFYKACWTEAPVLHLLPHWNFKNMEGKKVPVLAYTNCDCVELYLNGKLIGKRDFRFTETLHLMWEVEYEPGELIAYGYKNGIKVCEKSLRTSKEPYSLEISADRFLLKSNGKDLSYITISVHDSDGTLVPDACIPIEFSLEGPGFIAGVDNGDPTYVGDLKANCIPTLNGLCLVVIQSTLSSGDITLNARATGIKGDQITIKSIK